MRLTRLRADFRHWRRTRPFWAGLWVLPHQRLFTAVVSAAFSVISFATTNFGGLGLGMILGVLGSSMAFGWRPAPAAEHSGGGGGHGTERPGPPTTEGPSEGGSNDERSDGGSRRQGPIGTAHSRNRNTTGVSGKDDPRGVDGKQIPAGECAADVVRPHATASRAEAPHGRSADGARHRAVARRTPPRLLRAGTLACAAFLLSLVTVAPAQAQPCLPDGLPWLLPWRPAPPPCTDPPSGPDPSPPPSPAPPGPRPDPGTDPSEGSPDPSRTSLGRLPETSGEIKHTAVPPAPGQDKDLPLPALLPPNIRAAKLDARALEIKGSRILPTTEGGIKVLVMHAASVSLQGYRLDTVQTGPGLGLAFDITIEDVDLYLPSLSGTLRVAGVPLRLSLSADLLPDFLPLNVPLPRLALETVEAQQSLIVSPRAEFTGLRIESRSGG